MNKKNVSVTIVYDNRTSSSCCEASHGFACIVEEGEKKVLFDTGSRGEILLNNMKKLGFSPKDIDVIFISHSHWDHTGGLFSILAQKKGVKVYIPDSFSTAYKNEIKAAGAECIGIKGFKKISDGIYSSGELGIEIKEQAMIIDTSKGLIIITGCAHQGISDVLKTCGRSLNKKIYMVIGGFHLYAKTTQEIDKIIDDLKAFGVKYITPCHCTGEKAAKMLKKDYGENLIDAGTGKAIDID